jgi:hypothetical protein
LASGCHRKALTSRAFCAYRSDGQLGIMDT